MFGNSGDHDVELKNLLKSTESSNDPLPEAVKHRLWAQISSLRAEIDLIDSSTTASHRLEHSPDSASLHHHRSVKSALLTKLEASLSPIRNLPREIIGEILALCVSPTVRITTLSKPTDPPWNITQICSVWRGVALGLSSLWNCISVEFSCDRQTECVHFTTLLNASLSRTGDTSIWLDISVAMFYDDPVCETFLDSLIDVVRPYVGRLNHLEIQPADIFRPILGLPSGMVDALESLNLEFSREDGDSPFLFTLGDGLTNNITAFENAPNLQHVSLTSQFAEMDLSAFLFPWPQLTQLILLNTHVNFAHGHAVLRQCTNLVHCTIVIAPDYNCDITGIPPTHLPNLVSLNVQARMEDETHGLFLQPFILPSLRDLAVVSVDGGEWAGVDVTNLLKRSKITKLDRFDSDCVRPEDLYDILTEFPAVVERFWISFSRMQIRSNGSESSIDEVLTAIALGELAPNTKKLLIGLEDAWSEPPRPIVLIRCHPEEMQPAFKDFWLGLRNMGLAWIAKYGPNDGSVAFVICDNRNVLGVDGFLVNG